MKEKLIVCFSGTRASAFMVHWLLKNKQRDYDMIVVFPNTGKEREETLDFIKNCDEKLGFSTIWIEATTHLDLNKGVTARVVSHAKASRRGEPFEAFIQKNGIPNAAFSTCARELKAYAIRAYAKSIGWKKYYLAIGLTSDLSHLINTKIAKKERIIYPLIQAIKIAQSHVDLFWQGQSFDLQLKNYEGYCDLCFKRNLRKLMAIIADKPELADWWRDMEQKYGTLLPLTRRNSQQNHLPIRFYRDRLSIDDIKGELSFEYESVINENQSVNNAQKLSASTGYLDVEDSFPPICEAY